jgi:glycosyltransferase involved in cell wall biosynthesis
MKVLLSAFHCEPGRGSEFGIGWAWAQQAARFHEVWVVTLEEHRPTIEGTLSLRPLPNAHFVYVDLPRWRQVRRLGWLGGEIFYYVWQIAAYFVGRKLHRQESFDLVHHVTLVCYWRSSFLALLPVPFIWGPVGGGESAPRAFWQSFSLRGKIFELARDLARKTGECDPFVRHAARKATFGLATTEETAKRMRMLGCRRVSVLTQVGLPQEEIRSLSTIPLCHSGPFRLISIGRLIHWKGFHLSVRAFAEFHRQSPASEYWIIGDGPERKTLERLARRLGVAERVRFWGWLPRPEGLQRLAECDALVHPGLHESGGYVCSEAMAAGRPVICLDLGGPALQVTDETGIKTPATSPEQVVRGLADAFYKLASDPGLRARLSVATRKRVEEHFNWNHKSLLMAELYESLSTPEKMMTGGLADLRC